MIEKPNIYYSEPYYVKDKKAAWKVDKFFAGRKAPCTSIGFLVRKISLGVLGNNYNND